MTAGRDIPWNSLPHLSTVPPSFFSSEHDPKMLPACQSLKRNKVPLCRDSHSSVIQDQANQQMPMILTEGVSTTSQPLSKAVFAPQWTCSHHESSEIYSFAFWGKKTTLFQSQPYHSSNSVGFNFKIVSNMTTMLSQPSLSPSGQVPYPRKPPKAMQRMLSSAVPQGTRIA